MGQIVSAAAKPKRCNLNQLSQVPTPAAGEHILVSSDNSMNAAGQGNFDCYIVGNGRDAATALELHKIEEDVFQYFPDGGTLYGSPAIGIDNTYLTNAGGTASADKYFVSQPVQMKKGDTIYYSGYGSGRTWLARPLGGGTYEPLYKAPAYTGDFSWTADKDCEVVMSAYKSQMYKYRIEREYQQLASAMAQDVAEKIARVDFAFESVNNYYVAGTNNAYLGIPVYDTNFIATDYIRVYGIESIYVTLYGGTASNNVKGLAFYDENKVVIPTSGIIFSGEAAENNDLRHIVIPAGAYYMRSSFKKNIGEFECYYYTDGSNVLQGIEDNTMALAEANQRIEALQSQIDKINADVLIKDKNSVIMCDWILPVHRIAQMTSVAFMSVVSATEDSITLSESDAATITNTTPLAVGFSDGTYKVVYVDASNGSVLSRAAFDTTDLTNAVSVQNLHDTPYNGQGQHLSASGYLALANFTANDIIKKTEQIDKNLLAGIMFSQCELSKGYQNTEANNKVYDADGNEICTPIYTNWKWGGYTANGNNEINDRGVVSSPNIYNPQGWYSKGYRFTQGDPNESIEFPITANGKGFIQVECGLHAENHLTGRVRMDVYADGVLVGSANITGNADKYIFENVSVLNQYSVKFTTLDQADTYCVVYSINFFSMYPQVPAITIDSSTKIAVLGDSWTQFPSLTNAISGHDFNSIVLRPDGTNGDGCGYFPKELARLTGAQVDNWGKSNMTAANWGLAKIDEVLAHDNYDYVIIEFFINDRNAGTTKEQWKKNIVKLANKCQAAGVRPIVVMPCCTNSTSQSFAANGLGEWHEYIVQGLDS